MKIIEKIEIKNFRSFNNRTGEKNEVVKITDLNIFSGANDSGKSNILRALNLFFNKKIDLQNFFVFDKDYHKNEKRDEKDIKEELVTIRITFINSKNAGINKHEKEAVKLPERFWVSRRWKKTSEYSSYDQDDGVLTAFKSEKNELYQNFIDEKTNDLKSNFKASLSRQLTDFLDSIQFHYIPAIKDSRYFSHLYGELQQTLLKEIKSEVDRTKNKFQSAIQAETLSLMEEFKDVIEDKNVDFSPVFELPNLVYLFQTLNVNTGAVDLLLRGDGIQAKLIPEILYYISKKETSFTNKTIKSGEKSKRYFIWGFEEPENSYEYRNAQILAERFRNVFLDTVQIFLTTHSFNFLSLSGENISRYRVWKKYEYNCSKISFLKEDNNQIELRLDDFDSDLNRLNEELGVFDLNSGLQRIYEENNLLKHKLEKQIEENKKYEKILFVEDKYDQIYKIAWLKINDKEFDLENFNEIFLSSCDFNIQGLEGASSLAGFLRAKNIDLFKNNKIIGLFDFDYAGTEQFCSLTKTSQWEDDIFGNKKKCFYIKRKKHSSFYAILLPVPDRISYYSDLSHPNFSNYIEIENLIPEDYLIENDLVEEISFFGKTLLRFKDSKKSNFWKILINQPKDLFNDFFPLFERVESLFNKNVD
ncbi:MAG: hypothetical protein A2015_06395 [Spirochaetes bacterium GWF1_31_7]|nr:MAG: hypothetical protein A2Y30_08230 [Spirochaetes bacterium GWE1_32_154]OHD51375.1 MAG: hypothetical protein A2Y29_14615 [Spirochaetes bacterium GWE2_31_10]OHD53101.1 MAG: hypothetical protein A2015_06395 [Spirochaetes bacterium GWF1_31_7]